MSIGKIAALIVLAIVVIVAVTFLAEATRGSRPLQDILFNIWPWLAGAIFGLLGGLLRRQGGVGTLISTGLGVVLGLAAFWFAPRFGSFINGGPWDIHSTPGLFFQWMSAPLGGLLAAWVVSKVRDV